MKQRNEERLRKEIEQKRAVAIDKLVVDYYFNMNMKLNSQVIWFNQQLQNYCLCDIIQSEDSNLASSSLSL